MSAKILKLQSSTFLKASDMTKADRYRLALNYALQCFTQRGFMTKTSSEVKTEIEDLINGHCELVNGAIIYHQDMDLSKKSYVTDNWV